MPDDSKDLVKRIEKIEGELASTKKLLALAAEEIKRKDQIIEALQKRLFGKKSERHNPDQTQFDFGEDILGKAGPDDSEGDDDGDDEGKKSSRPRKRTNKRDLFPENLRVEIADVIVPDEVREDPDAYIKIGEEYHDELEAIHAQLYFKRTVREKYKKKEDRSCPPIIAPTPVSTIPGTMCGPQLMAMILADKYCDHLPHYRQSDRFLRRNGTILSRQTINGWTHAAAGLLGPVGQAIKNEIIMAEVLQIDETPAPYLNPGMGHTSRGYFWVYRDQVTGTIYSDWQLGRGHECLLEILGYDEISNTIKFRGIIQCDGFSAYQAIAKRFKEIQLAGCLAHIRRYFYDARKQSPELVDQILEIIKAIYRYERALRRSNAPPPDQCRLLVRKGHERHLVEKLKKIIDREYGKHLPKSKLGEAFTYALNQWEDFIQYLEDGRIEVDNNLIENAIRPKKLGLKNYLFIGSAEAGATSALIYTLIANCKAQGIDPERYFAEVLQRLTSETTVDQARELTPAKLAQEIKESQPVPVKLQSRRAA